MTSAGGDGKNVLTSTGNVGSLRIVKEISARNGSSAHLYDFHYFSMSRGSSKLFANIKFQWRIKIASALHTSNPNISELNFLTWNLSSSLVCKSLQSIIARPHHRLKEFNYTGPVLYAQQRSRNEIRVTISTFFRLHRLVLPRHLQLRLQASLFLAGFQYRDREWKLAVRFLMLTSV